MKHLYELRDMLMEELNPIISKGDLTAGSLEMIDKLTHSIKSIDTIIAMQEAGDYSYDGMSYADRRIRDNRGRYSSRMREYSGHDKKDVVRELRELMNGSSDSKTRQVIKQAIMDMED